MKHYKWTCKAECHTGILLLMEKDRVPKRCPICRANGNPRVPVVNKKMPKPRYTDYGNPGHPKWQEEEHSRKLQEYIEADG